MRKFTNQRGLAVLEVVIVAAIVAIFATAAVPQMAQIYDRVQFDYEMKQLYSTLNLSRSINKSSSYTFGIFPFMFVGKVDNAMFIMHDSKTSNNGYELKFNEYEVPIRERSLENGITMTNNTFSNTSVTISYESGDSGSVTLNLKLNESESISATISVDSVGRIHGEHN